MCAVLNPVLSEFVFLFVCFTFVAIRVEFKKYLPDLMTLHVESYEMFPVLWEREGTKDRKSR